MSPTKPPAAKPGPTPAAKPASAAARPATPPPPQRGGGSSDPAYSPKAILVEPFEPKGSSGVAVGAHKIMIYGPGGIGKSTLASMAPDPVFLDLNDGTRFLDVERIGAQEIGTFERLRGVLRSPKVMGAKTLVIDTATEAEALATDWVVRNVNHEKGHAVWSIEGFGYGKGYQHLYDAWALLLADLDQLHVRGINIVLLAHDCTDTVPNPSGEDFIRYEPRLFSPKSGKNSLRSRTFEWADHVFFVGYDVFAKDGKAVGGDTRTIFPREMPTHRAKSRKIATPFIFEEGSDSLWRQLS